MDAWGWLQVALAGLGLGISGYLTVSHYLGQAPVCGPSHGCAIVQSSPYAQLWGVPVALLGLLFYLVLASLPLAERRWPPLKDGALMGGFVLALGGLGFSAYLTWLELFVIYAVCWWCVASAVVVALLTGVTLRRAWRALEG
ncbi:Vitamin K epoxide reductase [bacterium HR23]|nr:Vitamin K epoxide reductase [bacterium HR23]